MSVATSAALDTTVVVTSCGRHDLLARTLQSFRLYNTDRGVARILVVEGGSTDPTAVCRSFGAEVICTGARVGQLRAIDLAYAQVHTPYIFHLEDDWEFYRSGFIEKSREFLKDPSILLVWLRVWNDTNGHPLSFEAPMDRMAFWPRTIAISGTASPSIPACGGFPITSGSAAMPARR